MIGVVPVFKDLQTRIRVELVKGPDVVIDEDLAKLLLLIDYLGSILRASRVLGIPYSRAWERIARAERILGEKLVVVKRGGRGGGGASLTDLGKELIARYLMEYKRVIEHDLELPKLGEIEISIAVYAGSHDLALERLVGILRESGTLLEVHWLGSARGIAALMLGEADVIGIHILDPRSGEYNSTYLKSIGLRGRVALVKGYERLQGFVTRRPMELDEIVRGLLRGELTLVNRCFGSGTRILLDYVLETWAKRMGIDPASIPKRVRGYEREAGTHIEVAESVAKGEADVGIAIAAAAKLHGLSFTPITWEHFDFAVPIEKLNTPTIARFITALKSSEFRSVLENLEGYRPLPDTGHIETVI